MIRNDDELAFVREQLGHIEKALASLRARVEPLNPRNYEVFAEGYVDQIAALQAEIDAYERSRVQPAPPVTSNGSVNLEEKVG
ncbi:MAG: hypothetical protein U0793_01670 [Gemmataceae bacterium]